MNMPSKYLHYLVLSISLIASRKTINVRKKMPLEQIAKTHELWLGSDSTI